MPTHRQPISAYVAGPDGFSEATRDFMEVRLIPWLRGLDVTVINPWEINAVEPFAHIYAMDHGQERNTAIDEMNMRIGERNLEEGIRPCTFVIANLDGQEIDSGTAAEIGAAAVLGKRIYGRRSDFRLSGEIGAIVNVQVAYFIRMTGGRIVTSFGDLQKEVEGYLDEFRSRSD